MKIRRGRVACDRNDAERAPQRKNIMCFRPSALILILLFFIFLAIAPATAAKTPVSDTVQIHKGIQLVAKPLPPLGTYDIDLVDPVSALGALAEAVDLIYEKSKFSSVAIDRLKQAGKVTIVYDPKFPEEKFASVTIAAFFPDFYQSKGHLKEFLVVVGRYGVKWPLKKLAAVIVHELGGHGYQHLRGRTDKDRTIDRECEAQLYEEAALQDFDVKRSTSDMVRFRRQMQRNWCADFRRYMQKRDPGLMELWQFGKPDVPGLLTVFEDYLAHQRSSGVSGKAIAASNEKRRSDFQKAENQAKRSNSGANLYAIAQRYFNGIGIPKDINKAHEWFLMSANTNYGPAQLAMGILLESGLAGQKNKEHAYMWYALAAKAAIDTAQHRLDAIAASMSLKEQNRAIKMSNAWKPVGK